VIRLAPGVYFIREGLGTRGEGSGKARKVVVTRWVGEAKVGFAPVGTVQVEVETKKADR